MDVEYGGWMRFGDTGQPYRWWKITEDVDEWGAKAGDWLYDRGPQHAKAKRFEVRRSGKGKLGTFGLKKLQSAYFQDGLPLWKPPREENEALAKGMKEISSALQELVRATDRKSEAEQKLAQVRDVVDRVKASPEQTEARSNAFLRLVRSGNYSNTGDAFRQWELLVDVPTIPATRTMDLKGPPHAIAGDVLVEEDDDLTPFELKRDGKQIGDPEWWQVRHLFVGLREDAPQGEDASESGTLVPSGFVPEGWLGVVYHAGQAVPGTPIRAGDFLFLRWGSDGRGGPNNLAPAIPVPRAHLAAADAAMEDGSLRAIAVHKHAAWGDFDAEVIEQCRAKLKKPQRANWSDASSPLVIVRPLVAPVSEPIRATSDEAALFELLHQVGGRMPREADHA